MCINVIHESERDRWAVGVAHLVERSLPKSEVHSSNPAIRKFNIEQLFSVN